MLTFSFLLQPNYTVSTDPGTLGTLGTTLGPTQSSSYAYFPADLNASLHGPAANQCVCLSLPPECELTTS